MSYLERLATKATGAGTDVRPRSRSRFEPPPGGGSAERGGEVAIPSSHAALAADQPERFARRVVGPEENGQTTTRGIADREESRPISTRADAVPSPRAAASAAERDAAPLEVVSRLVHRSGTTSPALTPSAPPLPPPRSETTAVFAEPPLARGGALRVPETGVGSIAPGALAADDEPRSDLERAARQVHVTIGRVEVRAVLTEAVAKQANVPRRPAALSLDEYLRKRGQP